MSCCSLRLNVMYWSFLFHLLCDSDFCVLQLHIQDVTYKFVQTEKTHFHSFLCGSKLINLFKCCQWEVCSKRQLIVWGFSALLHSGMFFLLWVSQHTRGTMLLCCCWNANVLKWEMFKCGCPQNVQYQWIKLLLFHISQFYCCQPPKLD